MVVVSINMFALACLFRLLKQLLSVCFIILKVSVHSVEVADVGRQWELIGSENDTRSSCFGALACGLRFKSGKETSSAGELRRCVLLH